MAQRKLREKKLKVKHPGLIIPVMTIRLYATKEGQFSWAYSFDEITWVEFCNKPIIDNFSSATLKMPKD